MGARTEPLVILTDLFYLKVKGAALVPLLAYLSSSRLLSKEGLVSQLRPILSRASLPNFVRPPMLSPRERKFRRDFWLSRFAYGNLHPAQYPSAAFDRFRDTRRILSPPRPIGFAHAGRRGYGVAVAYCRRKSSESTDEYGRARRSR